MWIIWAVAWFGIESFEPQTAALTLTLTLTQVLGDNVLKRLMDFDKDNVPDKVIKKLEKYTKDEGYTPETVGKVSNAAKSLCMWTHAMDVYSKVAKDVGPKKEALASAQATLASANAVLKGKQDELAAVIARVEGLEAQLAQAEEDQKTLADQADITKKRLVSAGKLTSALSDEQVRWRETADQIGADTELLVGDVFLGAACISYYGAFTGVYRTGLVQVSVAKVRAGQGT